jgi:putative transposase
MPALGFSMAALYKWRACYVGIDVSMMARVKELEEEPATQEDLYRRETQGRDCHRVFGKKVVRQSRRRQMAVEVVQNRGVAIAVACKLFAIGQSCYRYQAKNNAENEFIAHWLMRLTDNIRTWGFGLFFYLRNVKGFGWNHKPVYRLYRELELNLRIKPRNRIVSETPQPLNVPEHINELRPMDFMHDQLDDGCCF